MIKVKDFIEELLYIHDNYKTKHAPILCGEQDSEGTHYFCCCGLVHFALRKLGVYWEPPTTNELLKHVEDLSDDWSHPLNIGELLFIAPKSVGIYIGDGKYITSAAGYGVEIFHVYKRDENRNRTIRRFTHHGHLNCIEYK